MVQRGTSVGLFGRQALVVTPDSTVAQGLKTLLAQDHDCQIHWVRQSQEVDEALRSRMADSLFLDLRGESTGPGATATPEAFLRGLARRTNRHRVPIVGLFETGYPRLWARLADATVHGSLRLPLEREALTHLSRDELVRRRFESGQLPPAPKIIQSAGVRLKCYTPSMFDMLDHLVRMATHEVTLLLIGETGTGKTTIARLVHELSPRRQETLLTVACGALPPELIESELFGHVKGAFTSADRNKTGKFEVADKGSLLLDEIDALGMEQQAKLLRVIETGEFEQVGSNDTITSHCRLIVASNVDLKGLMERGEFRPDLYYRLNVLEFRIPPLRERPLDIVPLTLDFVDEFCRTHHIKLNKVHPEFLARLKEYHWPGNIRELKNHIRRAVLFARNGELTPKDLALSQLHNPSSSSTAIGASAVSHEPQTLSEQVAQTEQEILEEALKANNLNRTATARALGISRVGLYKKMKKYGMVNGKNSKAVALDSGRRSQPEDGAGGHEVDSSRAGTDGNGARGNGANGNGAHGNGANGNGAHGAGTKENGGNGHGHPAPLNSPHLPSAQEEDVQG